MRRNGFGRRMRQARVDMGLTAKVLAQIIGVSERTIRNYENGRSDPPLSRAIQIGKILSINLVSISVDKGK